MTSGRHPGRNAFAVSGHRVIAMLLNGGLLISYSGLHFVVACHGPRLSSLGQDFIYLEEGFWTFAAVFLLHFAMFRFSLFCRDELVSIQFLDIRR